MAGLLAYRCRTVYALAASWFVVSAIAGRNAIYAFGHTHSRGVKSGAKGFI